MMHLETGYPQIHNKIKEIISKVEEHNNNVSAYATNINERIRTKI